MKRLIGYIPTTVGIIGAVLILGAVGEMDNGGDLYKWTARALLGLAMASIAMAMRAVREEREKE